ncbi:putative transmembrane protein [Rhodopirellula islandica]|uniref:Transmembrane protein n=1 Tax=Rhodopirellula islandica TaxID=595434 RepID=A0A0J1B780_RHOIS|nr:hypothetical protein [Rhodopirellula islandica]KLU02423.1 putative transmembrane protein [Rhodopirellula islandica]
MKRRTQYGVILITVMAITLAWLLMYVLIALGKWAESQFFGDLTWGIVSLVSPWAVWRKLAIASWAISLASVFPRLMSVQISADRWLAAQGFLAGMLIRIVGTVALFLASSYYLDAPETWSAAWVLFWHVSLLSVEVVVIARFACRDVA